MTTLRPRTSDVPHAHLDVVPGLMVVGSVQIEPEFCFHETQ